MTDTASSDRRLTIRYVDLDKIKSAERNPKLHDLPTIRASLTRFGIADAAGIVNEATGKLVAGHGRVTALRDMRDTGDPAPAGVTVDAKGRWKVPVLSGVEFTDDAEAEAFLLAHNRTTELGGWDSALLADTLDDLGDNTGIGFKLPELPGLDPRPDEFPEYDDDIPTDYQCPSCGYEWSGKPAPAHTPPTDDDED